LCALSVLYVACDAAPDCEIVAGDANVPVRDVFTLPPRVDRNVKPPRE
jgi:hypothetical protein